MSAEDVTEGEEFKQIYSVLKTKLNAIYNSSETALEFLDQSLNSEERATLLAGVLLSLSAMNNCLIAARNVINPFSKQIMRNAEKKSGWRDFLKRFSSKKRNSILI